MANNTADLSSSYNYAAVTPSDTVSFTQGVARGFYVGVAGNVACVLESGTAITFTGVLAGAIYPIRCKRINSTSTTATNIVALF
jgi:hypothetical protein